jgi:hypothetical protein
MSDILRRLGLGKLALALWHRPAGHIRDSWRNGGPFIEFGTERQRREMETAAGELPPLPARVCVQQISVHLLTGRRFWYQTAFCLHSFARQSGQVVEAEIYDDGTLGDSLQARLTRLGSGVRIHSAREIHSRLEAHLPAGRFPVLRDRWLHYPNIRKLIDPHLGACGWKLVLDSDLLFFRRPGVILDWYAAPARPLHAVDCEESYGYSRALMERLAGAPIPPLVNVGLCGLCSETLNWDELEMWCAELIARERTSYYLEQALVAMIVARAQPCTVAPAVDYVTKPGAAEGRVPTAIMHHYVAESKRSYFRHGWRQVLGSR